MDAGYLAERTRKVTSTLRALMRDGEVLMAGYSGGKDSTTVLNLMLMAACEERKAGQPVPPLYVMHANTRIENPAVRTYALRQFDAIRAFSRQHHLDVRIREAEPTLGTTWTVSIIGGRKLPTFVSSSSRQCSVDLKREPIRRARRDELRRLAQEGYTRTVQLMGTRFEESASRARRMGERGESAAQIRLDDNGDRYLSPIADWSTDEVWEYLSLAGAGREPDAFQPDFAATRELYAEASGECVVVAEARQQSAACGARFGCSLCAVSGASDKSMETMLQEPGNAYLRGLNDLRNFIVDSRTDWSLRHWIMARRDPATGTLQVKPNNYGPEMTELLMRVMLSLDAREARRATGVARQLARGVIEDTASAQRMAVPQFQLLTMEEVVAIDFYWSLRGLHRPFHALKILHETQGLGHELDPPIAFCLNRRHRRTAGMRPGETPPEPSPEHLTTDERERLDAYLSRVQQPLVHLYWEQPQPRAEQLPVSDFYAASGWRLHDPLLEALGEGCGPEATDALHGSELQVHLDDWLAVYDLELPELFARHNDPHTPPTAAADYYLRMGIVSVRHGDQAKLEAVRQRTLALHRSGLLHLDPEGLKRFTLPGEPKPANPSPSAPDMDAWSLSP